MKQYRALISIVLVVSILASCKEARYPIDDKPAVKIDMRLLGKWKAINTKGHKDIDDVYKLSRKNDYQYQVLFYGGKKKDKESTTAYLSKVNDVLFLNVDTKDDSGGYLFLKIMNIDAKAGKVIACSLADTLIAANSTEVRALITKNLNNPSFYKDTVELDRIK